VRIGLTRVMFPFFAGVLLMRLGKRIKVPNAFAVCSLLLIVGLSLPRFGMGELLWINGLYEAAVVILLFPLIVAIGAGEKDHRHVAALIAAAEQRHDLGVVLEAQLLVEVDGRPAFPVGQQVQPVGHAHGLGPLQRRRQQELADLAAARGLQHAHLGQLEPAVLHRMMAQVPTTPRSGVCANSTAPPLSTISSRGFSSSVMSFSSRANICEIQAALMS
jgi:hypothetical protein